MKARRFGEPSFNMEEGNFSVHSNLKKLHNSEADRITALPNPILHHILSFLDMKEVVETSLVARRWRHLWFSVPGLNFNHSLWKKITKKNRNKIQRKNGFMDFVDKVLLFRDGSNISTFQVSCSLYCNSSRIDAWMTSAARKDCQEIRLEIYPDESCELLFPGVFTSNIKVFQLEIKYQRFSRAKNGVIQLPNSICVAPLLKTLLLEKVKLPKGDPNGKIVLSCPMLEELTLHECEYKHLNVFHISSPELNHLLVNIPSTETVRPCKIKISAPKLKSLERIGVWYSDFSISNSSSLVSAKMTLMFSWKFNLQILIKVLQGLSTVTTLQLSGSSNEILSLQTNDTTVRLPNPFTNLRCLEMTNWSDISSVNFVLSLLRSSPYIETLVLGVHTAEYCVNEPFPCIFSSLKSVEIELDVYENEIKFIESLLQNAVVLKKLTIITWYCSKKEMAKFAEKIHSLPRASSSLTMLLLCGM